MMRIGMGTVIEHCPGLELVGQAATADEALARIGATRPDVVILDVELGGGPSGIEVCPGFCAMPCWSTAMPITSNSG